MQLNLNERAREIFRTMVEAYLETGEPVGSHTLAQRLGQSLSPATVRNVMADLEDAGIVASPHTSAGRIPTESGLRLFVNGLLEIGELNPSERSDVEAQCVAEGKDLSKVLEQATSALSGLSRYVGLVVAPKHEAPLKHIEFVPLGPGRALVVLVSEDGAVENRFMSVPLGLPGSVFTQASNYLTARLVGRTLAEAQHVIQQEIASHKTQLDKATERVVQAGLAVWADEQRSSLIVRGQSNLLSDITALNELEQIRELFQALEMKDNIAKLLDAAVTGQGVHIYIGQETQHFGLTGCSLIMAPYTNSRRKLLGAVGVIGPTRMNYGRIIPLVDYTARVVSKFLG